MLSFSMFFGCNQNADPGNNNSSELQLVTFDKSSLSMIVGDEEFLIANVNQSASPIKVVYSSSNKNVAEIEQNGKITAKAKGSATITAKYGTYSATCKVNVTHGNYLPSLIIENVEGSSLVVPKGVDYKLNSYVLFNGKKYENVTYTYTTSNANVSVKNGVITGKNFGETTVTVKAKWDGVSGIASMTKTLNVEVTPFVSLFINGGSTSEVTIYNQELPTLNGTTSMDADFVVTAFDENGNVLTPSVSISDTSIATYADGKIEGHGKLTGDTPVTVTVSVPVGGSEFKLYVKLNCLKAVADYMTQDKSAYKTVDFDTLTGIIDVDTIFGKDTSLLSAKHGREDLVVENGKITKGIEGNAFTTPDPIVITLYDDTTGYNVEILPYVFKNAQELTENFNFSSHDGVFFNQDFVKKTVDDLLGSSSIKQAYLRTADGQQELTVSQDGLRITGIEKSKNPESIYLAVASTEKMVYIPATAYTLIVDEMSDFEYFYIADGTWSYKPNVFKILEGVEWDGYYVLANDIDATMGGTYQFKGLQNGFRYLAWGTTDTYYNATFGTLGATYWESKKPEGVGLKGKGFQGVFDGRGHTISNYSPASGGLFQFINGGVVKNLGFENASVGYSEGVLCANAFNSASIENVFVQVNPLKSYGTKYAAAVLTGSVSATVKMSNVVIVNEGTTVPTGNYAGTLASMGTSTTYGSDYDNIYIVSPQPLQFTKSGEKLNLNYEASYVDGVAIDSTTNKIVPKSRRYSNFENFFSDKANVNSSAFDTTMWKMLSDAIPVMETSIKDEHLEIYVGDAKANEAGSAVTLEANTPITLRYGGLIYDYVDSIAIGSGSENVSTNGYNVYGKKIGEATLTATYNRDGRIITREFNVLAVPELTTFETEYYFSSKTGEFFSMNDKSKELTVVNDPLNILFGKTISGSDLYAAYDKAGNPLDITSEPGKLLGLQTISDGYLDTFIDIYSQDAGVKVIVKACDLIIDEASDFEFFKIKKDVINHQGPNMWKYEFAADDFAWDGYYVLAKDIDASEYGIHDLDNGKIVTNKGAASTIRAYNGSRLEYLGDSGIKTGSFIHGLLGTFDGRGYVISNLTTTQSGLFGVIAGEGTVKNVGFIDCKVNNHAGGFLAWAITGGGKLQDVYATTDNSNIGSNYSPLVSTWGQAAKANNVIIEDNTLLKTNSTSSSYAYGSLSYSNINDSTGTPRPQLQFKKDYLNNFFIISDKPLQATVPSNVLGNDLANHTVGLEAQFVDGVEYANANIIALGIKRYTSTANMRLDTTNDYTSFNSEVWTFVNGAPKFIRALDKAVSVYFGEQEVKNGEIEVLKGQQYPVTLRIDGVAVDLKDFGGNITVTLESGNSVSVTDNVISAVAVSDTPSIVKISNGKFNFSVAIDVVLDVEEHDEELYLSAEEGILFDANFNPISVASIFDANSVELIKVYDAFGGLLTVGEDNTILGAGTSSTGYFETYVILYTADKAIKVDLKVASLIIDEASDLSYFTIKKPWDFNKTLAWGFTFSEGDFAWDGYYVLVKDINASDYGVHYLENGTHTADSKSDNVRQHSGAQNDYLFNNGISKMGVFSHGLLGTFDGQGHVISNLTTKASGLFGVIAGSKAMVKNVGFVNCGAESNNGAVLAYSITGGAQVQDVFVETNGNAINSMFTPLISTWGVTTKATNMVVIDNAELNPNIAGSDYNYGSLTSNVDRYLTFAEVSKSFAPAGISLASSGFKTVFGEDAPYFESVVKATITNESKVGTAIDFEVEWYSSAHLNVYEIADYIEVTKLSDTSISIKVNKQLPGPLKIKAKFEDSEDYSNAAVAEYRPQTLGFGDANFTNVIVISNKPLGAKVAKGVAGDNAQAHELFVDAGYVNGVKFESNKFVVKGIKRYTSVQELVNDSTANAEILASFSSDLWTVSEGNITFKNRNNVEIVYGILNGSTLPTAQAIVGETLSAKVLVNGVETTADNVEVVNGTATAVVSGSNVVVGETSGTFTVKVTKNSQIFEFTVTVEEPVILQDGERLNENTLILVKGESRTITLTAFGKEYTNFTLDTAETTDILTIDGNVIKASETASGEMEVRLTVNGIAYTFDVFVFDQVEQSTIEPYFSAGDGVFFAEDLSDVMTNEALFGQADVQIISALDEDGNLLEVTEDGRILGVKTGKTLTETSITIYTNVKAVKVNVKAYGLVIDEAKDFAFFSINSPITNYYMPTNGEGLFDGYYVMIKDVDFVSENYVHNYANSSGFAPASRGLVNVIKDKVNGTVNFGLTGTFDGQGHVIKNLKIATCGGLFGIIYGGTVKNLGMITPIIGTSSNTGMLASYVLEGSTITDMYWEMNVNANNGWNNQWIILGSDSNVTISNMVVNWDADLSGWYYNGGACGIIGESNTNPTVSDIYLISSLPASFTGNDGSTVLVDKTTNTQSTTSARRIRGDAAYVDGVAYDGSKETRFYHTWAGNTVYDLSKYDITYSGATYTDTYTAEVITGMKRYTSLDKMKADAANNNFSNFNSDIWLVIDGVPTFASTVDLTYYASIDGVKIEADELNPSVNQTKEINVKIPGVDAVYVPTLEVTSGNAISVSGNTFTTIAVGTAKLLITYKEFSKEITINVLPEVTNSEKQYMFSAGNGLFYDGNNVVDIQTVFGSQEEILNVYDANGNELTVSDGKLLGLKTTKSDGLEDTSITIFSANSALKVFVQAAELIIDDAQDLSYFQIKQDPIITATNDNKTYIAHGFEFAEGDVEFGGYYMLLNDIDATDYTHDFKNGFTDPAFSSFSINNLQGQSAIVNKGLTGTFDGNGYAITSLKFNSYGLFGIVNGGTIKNLSLDVLPRTDGITNKLSNSGFFGTYMINGAKVTDTTISVLGDRNFGYIAPFIASSATQGCLVDRVIINWPHWAETGPGEGIFSYCDAASSVMNEIYFINSYNRPLMVTSGASYQVTAKTEGAATESISLKKVAVDAKYVDGVEQGALASLYYKVWASNVYSLDDYTIGSETPYSYVRLENAKRYSSFAKMTEDAENNTFSNWSSDIWTVVKGIPKFNNQLLNSYTVSIGGNQVATEGAVVALDKTVDVTVSVDGETLAKAPTVEINSGSEYVSVSGNQITGKAEGDAQIKVTLC